MTRLNLRKYSHEFISFFDAIKAADLNSVKRLLEKSVNLEHEQEGCRFKPSLELAFALGHLEIAKLLINAGAVPCLNEHTMSHAIHEHRYEMVAYLIELGFDVNQKFEDENSTALIEAAQLGNINIVKKLVESGADVNAINNQNDWALMSAACQGWHEIYDYLTPLTSPELRYWAEKQLPFSLAYRERKNDKLLDEFITAAATGDIDTLRAAIKKKVNVNAFGTNRSTALFIAANWGYVSIVRALLKAKANVNLGDEDSRETPLMIAATRTALKKYKVCVGELGQVEVIKLLIEAGADVNAKTNEGWTALMAAANAGSVEVVELLLKAGANVKYKTREKETALSRALEGGYQEIIQLLTAAGTQ